jgi:hypothetical protein
MKKVFQAILPDLIAVAVFVILSVLFFSPTFEGKVLYQNDMTHVEGGAHELQLYKEKTGEIGMWTNSMFGGMPAYLVFGGKTNNIFHSLQPVLRLFLPYYTSGILFIYLLGFYFLLRVLKIKPFLSFIGAVAFSFSSYNLIIIAAGHITKAYAIGYMAPVLAGILLTYQGRYIFGGLVTLFATGFQIATNHFQITYYTFLIVGLFILFKLYESIKAKNYRNFLLAGAISFSAIILSFVPNVTSLWTIWEYSKYSTRGESQLTDQSGSKTKALSKDYILNDYSFEINEPLELLIPNFKGGPTVSALSTNSEMYKLLLKNGYPRNEAENVIERMPTYYGSQISTAGPVYAGAIAIFLFTLALFLLQGPVRWWIITSVLFSIGLAWGKFFPALSNLFIDFFPAYDKFRTVSMILVVAGLLIPFAAILGIDSFIKRGKSKKELENALKYSLLITGGLTLLIAVLGPGMINFSSPSDASLPDVYKKAIEADRAGLLRADAFRSLAFIVLAAVAVWLYLKEKVKEQHLLWTLCILILVDLWVVDKRYVNESNYVTARIKKNMFAPTRADLQILQDTSYYRVFNLTANNPFSDATTSYFHKSIGGYHGAKMKRYQDLIEKQIAKNNIQVLNMLNTRYIIYPGKEKGSQLVNRNPDALGNAWFVDSLIWVTSPDEEMSNLDSFEPSRQAVINKNFSTLPGVNSISPAVKGDTIYLTVYKPDELTYHSESSGSRFAVFSEIYYPKGWEVYIDGKPVDYAQVNYVLRGMTVPEGSHTILFRFRPRSYYVGHNIAMASSVLSFLLLLGGIVWSYRKKDEQ